MPDAASSLILRRGNQKMQLFRGTVHLVATFLMLFGWNREEHCQHHVHQNARRNTDPTQPKADQVGDGADRVLLGDKLRGFKRLSIQQTLRNRMMPKDIEEDCDHEIGAIEAAATTRSPGVK